MKKTLLLAAVALFSMTMFAQTRSVFLQESFDGSSVPGWTVQGLGTNNWFLSQSNNAGGQPNELVLYWDPQFNGTSRFVSPAVDLTGIESVVVSFKHALDNYGGSHTLGIATSSDGGTTWNEGWSKSYSSSTQYSVCQEITTPDMGKSAVQFCIFYTGNSYNINNWYFDDIEVFTLENLDLGVTAITVPDYVGSGELEISANVFNYGSTTITSVEASYQIGSNPPVVQTFDVNVLLLSSTALNFAVPANMAPGTYDLEVSILSVNGTSDDFSGNNSLWKTVSVALGTAQRIPMIEHFTASTCGYCPSPNVAMLNLCNNNPGKYTYTKYQMNWPGSGDPYYTAEGGVRRSYYNVNGVPSIFFDGTDSGVVSQGTFDNEYNTPSFVEVRGAFTVEGNVINVSVDIMSYVDLNNATVMVSVNEKETHNNVGTNGETSFHHVMMKMLPDANGTQVDIPAGGYQHIEFTQDMSSTNVEEMDDLEVSVWVEEHVEKSIYNSHFLYENMAHPYPATNLVLQGAKGDVTATWENPTAGAPTEGYNVFVNGELVAENTTATEYSFPAEYGVFYAVEVQAVYGDDITSVKAAAGMEIGLSVEEDAAVEAFKMYPNPADNRVYVQAESEIQTISIYNTLGALVEVLNVNRDAVELNLEDYNNGIYLINIRQANGNNAAQRLIVAR